MLTVFLNGSKLTLATSIAALNVKNDVDQLLHVGDQFPYTVGVTWVYGLRCQIVQTSSQVVRFVECQAKIKGF
ncbi:hypothetical protein CC2G_007586 [Coprinopsis cinerea AmutBmut pab1-1]|nr:hypothetical protein CC2G_015136 [Coprinopsis cinerea AmutBmut pab1-1]KAG2007520.1 hypothetical protein CC2G_015214 [Coprinopsis cinerea AmutBmut pab1-1]KAG2018136.1 hypothetical protein CC2G_007586 [Coprinopsis cinerea AmutBmut pab1-1]